MIIILRKCLYLEENYKFKTAKYYLKQKYLKVYEIYNVVYKFVAIV